MALAEIFALVEAFMTETKKKKDESRIDIYKAWCKACGICAAFCPTHVLARDEAGYPYVKEIEKCTRCAWCEIRCPDFAITVEKAAKPKKGPDAKDEEEPERGLASGE